MLISDWISAEDIPTLAKHQSYEGQVTKLAKTLFCGILQPKSCNPQWRRTTSEGRKWCHVVASIKISGFQPQKMHFSQPSTSSQLISHLQWKASLVKPTMLVSQWISPKTIAGLAKHQSYEGQVRKLAKTLFCGILQPKSCNPQWCRATSEGRE